MARKTTACRLCLRRNLKLCNSHIIPEFFYKEMNLYDEKHRFNVLSTEPTRHRPTEQKGVREKLLCKDCEAKLSVWEGYARRTLYGGPVEITVNEPRGVEFAVDYTKFKLFQLSILWRVGISSHPGFASATLGDHEHILRKMLDEENPGSTGSYGCLILYSTRYTDITSNMIHYMGTSDNCVYILLGGCFWLFFLQESLVESHLSQFFLQESGHLRVVRTDKDPNRYIERLARDLHRANPLFFERGATD